MKIIEVIACMFAIVFCLFVYTKIYSLIFKDKIRKFNLKDFPLLFIIVIIAYYNTFYNYGFSKIIISFLEIFIFLKLLFNDILKSIFIKTIILYLIAWIVETFLGGLIFYLFFDSIQQFDNNPILKVLFSTLMMLIILLISYSKNFKKIINKIYNYMIKTFNLTLSIILFMTILIILTFYLIISNDIFSYISVMFLTIILGFLFITIIIQTIKTKKADEKQEILLSFIKEYEILMDNERMTKHEMVNNLLILKSIKNKNTKEYEKILSEIIESYKTKKTYKGIYDLPSGLKGLLYYKIYDMKNKGIEVFVNISEKVINKLDSLTIKSLSKLCKILGILLDNACEASEKANNKLVIIDVYEEENNIVIYIENTMVPKEIDLNKIKSKGFSTKGKDRGYGLFLVEKTINETTKLELNQKIEKDKFISIVKIKK